MATCKSCGAEIEWITTPGGKSHPVDVNPEKRWIETRAVCVNDDGAPASYHWNLVAAYLSHFATCPQSKRWSGKGKKP